MKTSALVPGYAIILMFLGGCCGVPNQAATDVPISEVVRQVQDALSNIQTTIDAQGLPKLKGIKLSLQTTTVLKASGEIDYLVLAAKGSHETDRTQSFDITLSRVYPKPVIKRLGAEPPSLTVELENAIKAAINGLRSTYAGEVPLEVSQIDVQISFKVVVDASLSAGFKLMPVSPSAGIETSKAVTHTITVSYAKLAGATP
jgi:Trypsin-co-occurring domain 2